MLELSLIAKIVLVGSLIGGVAVYKSRTPTYKDDNPVEEAIEMVLHKTTGLDVDLTPESPEKP
jgi:hypothetical protein